MDKDRVVGSAKQVKGAVKGAVSRAAGQGWLRRKVKPTRSKESCRMPVAA